jgi:hypothetical protein
VSHSRPCIDFGIGFGELTDFVADKTKIQDAMRVASKDVIASEPDLTRWDTVSRNLLS